MRDEYWPIMLFIHVWPHEGREAMPVVAELTGLVVEAGKYDLVSGAEMIQFPNWGWLCKSRVSLSSM